MESFFVRFKNALVLIALLLVQTIALATQVRRAENPAHPDSGQVRLIRLWAAASVAPFERVATSSGHGIRAAWGNYIGLRHVRQQNADLQKEIASMRLERAALAEDALQAQRLSKLLNFRQHYVSQTVLAQVLGTSGTDGSRLLLLDKGANDGLKPGMPVITPDGIVGKLRDVFPGTSELLLLSDPTSGAGVLLASTRIRAIVKGSAAGKVLINNLTQDDRIKPGEKVLTSGGDMVFPRGLPVGTIQSIAPDPEHQPYTAITLVPAANLNQLEEVLIITGMGDSLDPATQGELTADAIAARAADASAERLPSIHDHDAPVDPAAPADAAAPPANNSTDLVPKPKPVNHPDQYSPGAAPPAADLKPGAPQQPGAPQNPGAPRQ